MPPPRLVMNLCLRMQVGQVRHFHRVSLSKRLVLLGPKKFTTPDLKYLTAANFTFIRHSSGDGREQPELLSSDNRVPVDLTEDVIPEAPEVPIEAAAEQVEIALVHFFFFDKHIWKKLL